MTIPIHIDRTVPTALHRQLYDVLRDAILSGRLSPGTRVPSTRELARQLDVARTTVMISYEQLIADGYLEARPGAWTSVTRDLPDDLSATPRRRSYPDEEAPPITRNMSRLAAQAPSFAVHRHGSVYDFSRPFMSAVDVFPLKEWRRMVIEQWSRSTPTSLTSVDPAGVFELRQALTGYVRTTRGIECDADQIIITTGSEQAIDIMSRIVLEPGARTAIEDPTNVGVQYLYRSHRSELLPISVDGDGLVVDELRAVRGRQPVLVHVMPTHQFPTGVRLSLRRRLELLHWARTQHALIVEDDYASEFSYEGAALESLQALDSAGVVAYLGSFTKVLNPSIQIGYLIVPPALAAAAKAVHRLTARQSEVVHQRVLARFMQEGRLARYLRRLQRVHVARRDALVQTLRETFGDDVVIGPATAGFHVHVRWPGREITPALLERLEAEGVSVIPVHPLYQRRTTTDGGVVMAFASLDERRIRAGVSVIGKVLSHR